MNREFIIKQIVKDVLENNQSAFSDIQQIERELKKLYKLSEEAIMSEITKLMGIIDWNIAEAQKYDRLTKLMNEIKKIVANLGSNEEKLLSNNLQKIYISQYNMAINLLGQYIKTNFATINKSLVLEAVNFPWSGAMFSERIWDNMDLLVKNLRDGITQSLILGEGIPKVAKRINAGINNSVFNSVRIARTEVMRISYVAEKKAFVDNDIKRVKYVATTSDERTCKICGKDHYKDFDIDSAPELPRHPQCRCTYAPIIE